jgi:invasion protein IalB
MSLKQSGSWRQSYRIVLATFCLLAPAIGEALAQEQATLPGGASSLQETYNDWIVNCVQRQGRHCLLQHQQNQENGQRLLAIEVVAGADGKTATGALVLPFGLALDAGVALQVDDKPSEAPLRFSTCLSAGCVVPLNFDGAFLAALRTGTTLKMMAKAVNTNEAISLSASLKGFSAAFDRVTVLMK